MTGGILTNSVVGRSFVGRSTSMDVTTYRIGGSFIVGRCVKIYPREPGSNEAKGRCSGRTPRFGLYSSLTYAWQDSRMCSKVLLQLVPVVSGGGEGHHGPIVVDDLGGQYEESFDDVQKHLLDYFTYKAVRTVLAQLSEMNPHQYAWFYNFVVNNKPQDSKVFIRLLVKRYIRDIPLLFGVVGNSSTVEIATFAELGRDSRRIAGGGLITPAQERQELGERVMVTRLHLFNKWVKKYNHAQLHKAISDQNLELLRERLIQTVKFTNSIGDDIETTPP